MMNHSYNHPLRTSLIKQLLFIDENRLHLLDQYLSTTAPRDKDYQFFDRYVSEVEKYLINFDYQFIPCLDQVFIGSQVSLRFEEDKIEEDFTICFPDQSDPANGYISFLSPVGRQVLLRNRSEKMVMNTPNGDTNVVITDIKFNYN